MWGLGSHNFYEKYFEPSKTLSEKLRNDNIGVISKRQTGKSLLTALLIFHYGFNSTKKINLCSIMGEPLNHKMDDICYFLYGGRKWGRSHYDFLQSKHYRYKKPFLGYLRQNKLDIVVIDEFFYLKFPDDELKEMFYKFKMDGTKVIINGTPQFLLQTWEDRYIEKIKKIGNLKIIREEFIINLPNYSRLTKIKKLKEQCQPKEKINL